MALFLILAASSKAQIVYAGGGNSQTAIGTSDQTGYSATYTAGGTLTAVQVDIDTLPSLSLGSRMNMALNTGNISSCSGFMQDIAQYEPVGGPYLEYYMNGDSGCIASEDSSQASPQIASGDRIWMEIYKATSTTTTYYIEDLSNSGLAYETVTSLSTWTQDSWQTMTEYFGTSGSVPSFDYDKGNFTDTGTKPIGGSGTSVTGSYGGACATASYSLGSWSNSIHGYNEPSFTTEGFCSTSYTTSNTIGSGGQANNPTYADGTPNGQAAQLRGPNSGDGGYDIVSFGQSVGGELHLFAYSYNNGGGAYDSEVIVSTSSDDTHWTQLYSSQWTPSATNTLAWVDIGSVSNIEYVNVTTIYYGGYSANLYVGAVEVG